MIWSRELSVAVAPVIRMYQCSQPPKSGGALARFRLVGSTGAYEGCGFSSSGVSEAVSEIRRRRIPIQPGVHDLQQVRGARAEVGNVPERRPPDGDQPVPASRGHREAIPGQPVDAVDSRSDRVGLKSAHAAPAHERASPQQTNAKTF